MKNQSLSSLSLLLALTVLQACSGGSQFKSQGHFDKILGDIPDGPIGSNLGSGGVEAAGNSDDGFPTVTTKDPVRLIVGQNGIDVTCVVPAGQELFILGKRGPLQLVNVPAGCEGSNGGVITDGYVAGDAISVPNTGNTDDGDIDIPTSGIGTNICTSVTQKAVSRQKARHKPQRKVRGRSDAISGVEFRHGGPNTVLEIVANAQQFTITAEINGFYDQAVDGRHESVNGIKREMSKKVANRRNKIYVPPKTLNAEQYKVAENTYVVPYSAFLTRNDWVGIGADIFITPVSNGQSGKPCTLTVAIVSPLVLTFGDNYSVNLDKSDVKFDLLNTGRKLQTGWINANAGFLVVDKNNDGKIESGAEMFGDATVIKSNSKLARNGFEALAQHDSNNDGVINKKDVVFSQLKVWIDKNSNGLTDKGELVSLKSLGVTALGVKYETISDSKLANKGLMDNVVKYEAKYWGPKRCGTDGCALVDIYFATAGESVASK